MITFSGFSEETIVFSPLDKGFLIIQTYRENLRLEKNKFCPKGKRH